MSEYISDIVTEQSKQAASEPEYDDTWLDPDYQDTSDLQELLKPHDSDFKAYPVSSRVNKPADDDPECIEQLIS